MAQKPIQLIVPTAINLLTELNEVMLTRHRAGLTREIELPSLRRRALMVVREIGVLPVQTEVVTSDTGFTR